uniref:Galectin n=2 Tax=Lygus hesperus TaxID=30085 RepID=A0A0A9ZGV4_LYGHE
MLAVPYIGPVQRPLVNSGIIVRINGQATATARRFNINLQCGPSLNPRDDVALHLAVDFDGQCIITNNILGNQWGPQECDNRNFPFHRGAQFVIDVVCEQSAFQINVNTNRSVRYEHRMEPSRITHLAIDGDIILNKIDYIGGVQPTGPIGFSVSPTTPHLPPYPSSTLPPYPAVTPAGGYPLQPPQGLYASQPMHVPSPNPSLYPQQPGPYPQQPGTYPQQPGPYQLPGSYPQQPSLYPQQPGMHAQQPYGSHYPNNQHKQKGLLDKIGLGGVATGGILGTAATGAAGLYGMKHMKKQAKISKKAQKKALKYGIPLAGVGLGAYALHKTKFGSGSSSSSSSSSSD